jgi:hypothetical protein
MQSRQAEAKSPSLSHGHGMACKKVTRLGGKVKILLATKPKRGACSKRTATSGGLQLHEDGAAKADENVTFAVQSGSRDLNSFQRNRILGTCLSCGWHHQAAHSIKLPGFSAGSQRLELSTGSPSPRETLPNLIRNRRSAAASAVNTQHLSGVLSGTAVLALAILPSNASKQAKHAAGPLPVMVCRPTQEAWHM